MPYTKRKAPAEGTLGIADPGAFDVDEAASYLRKGRATVFDLCSAGLLRYYRNGTKILIPYRELVRYQTTLVEDTMQKEHGIRAVDRG